MTYYGCPDPEAMEAIARVNPGVFHEMPPVLKAFIGLSYGAGGYPVRLRDGSWWFDTPNLTLSVTCAEGGVARVRAWIRDWEESGPPILERYIAYRG